MILSTNKMTEVFHHYLAEDYELGEYDVFCGRGSQSLNHIGNRHFCSLIQSMLNRYANARIKQNKIDLITEVIQQVRSLCGTNGGGFIKQDLENWRYFEIGDAVAREKVSQAFRDAIREKTRKLERKDISTSMSQKIGRDLTKECSSRKMKISLSCYGSSTLSKIPNPSNLGNNLYTILKEEGDFSHGQHDIIASRSLCDNTVTTSSIECNDVSNYCSCQIEQKTRFADESTTNSHFRKDIMHTPNQTKIDLSNDDVDEDNRFFNVLLQYSEMFQWESNSWYEPIPLK